MVTRASYSFATVISLLLFFARGRIPQEALDQTVGIIIAPQLVLVFAIFYFQQNIAEASGGSRKNIPHLFSLWSAAFLIFNIFLAAWVPTAIIADIQEPLTPTISLLFSISGEWLLRGVAKQK